MGKKSKKAATKAKVGAGVPPATAGFAGCDTGGSIGAGSAKLKCARCFGNIKEGKAKSCPGCSLLYCWRCERKTFEECPNGEHCVGPASRCIKCTRCETIASALREEGRWDEVQQTRRSEAGVEWLFELFEDCVGRNDRLSQYAIPFRSCGSAECNMKECFLCFQYDSPLTLMKRCCECKKGRCGQCRDAYQRASSAEPFLSVSFAMTTSGGRSASEEELMMLMSAMRGRDRDMYATCATCQRSCCFECLDDRSASSLAKSILEAMVRDDSDASMYQFQCTTCYWKSKPCTNPSCPNEVGVPTKRCGGCHIDRYCSVECQAAAYPDHVARCEKIQAKRAANEKMEG